ncbi:MAG TPA: PilT/PilU family type 4a pilus ATPase [Acidimicrobiia bacterium]|jgi:twitching motility protein PilT
MELTIEELLHRALAAGASGVHLKVGSPPTLRVEGDLKRLDGVPVLKPDDTEAFAQQVFTQRAVKEFKETGEADFAYGRPELGRFRVSAFRQRGSISLVLRRVLGDPPSLDSLGLPAVVGRLTKEQKGLILITGPSGSGKTTTLSAMLDTINHERAASIVTIEDPIEVLHKDKLGLVAQREVGVDVVDVEDAVRRAVRQDADVIVISEISTLESARAALWAAESGHLVLATTHTTDPADTVTRLAGYFPPAERALVRRQLASHLRAVISQRLLERADGTGRVVATEVMTTNERVQERILDEHLTVGLDEVLKESEFFGMHTFDQTLQSLVVRRMVAVRAALPHVRNPHELKARALEVGIEI